MSFRDYMNTYEFECELPGSREVVKFKPLVTKQIKKLLAHEDDTYEKVEEILDRIISLAVINEDFNIDNLYLQDRFFLTVEIRKKSKGETYDFQFDCPSCESQNYISVNLDNLPVNYLNKKKNNINTEVKLTNDVSVNMWYITRGEEKEALSYVDPSLDDEEGTETQLNILAQGIKTVNSPDGKEKNLSFDDRKFIIDNSTQKNLADMSNWFRENQFGIDFRFTKKCKSCGYSETTTIPLRNFFS